MKYYNISFVPGVRILLPREVRISPSATLNVRRWQRWGAAD